jgi:hypothetical protein
MHAIAAVHQEMNVVDQNQHHRSKGCEQHENNRARRQQQQADCKPTAVDVEMAQRMHEILQKERRAGHEHQQRHVRIVEAKCSTKQLYKEPERDQPDGAAQRKHQPYRHFCEKQRYHRADQRAFRKTEMIIDQKMDVGDIRLARDLVEKNPCQNGGIDGQHQTPGVFPHTQIHSAPEDSR